MIEWTKVFHLLGMVFWIGSLLIVTNLLAVHTRESSPEARQALGRAEMKLFNGLAHPGAALMVISGIILLTLNPSRLHQRWLHTKLLLVATLMVLDAVVYLRAKAFHAGRIELRRGQCMALHGVIALIFLGILTLVLVKPF